MQWLLEELNLKTVAWVVWFSFKLLCIFWVLGNSMLILEWETYLDRETCKTPLKKYPFDLRKKLYNPHSLITVYGDDPKMETAVGPVLKQEGFTCLGFHRDTLLSHSARLTLFINTPTQEVLFIGAGDRDQRRTKSRVCRTSIYGRTAGAKRKLDLLLEFRLWWSQDKHHGRAEVCQMLHEVRWL